MQAGLNLLLSAVFVAVPAAARATVDASDYHQWPQALTIITTAVTLLLLLRYHNHRTAHTLQRQAIDFSLRGCRLLQCLLTLTPQLEL
jgi:hypothetical protein